MIQEQVKVCPLCGRANDCGMVKSPDKPCWCTNEVFPKELLEQVPEELKHKACICYRCLKEFRQNMSGK